MKAESQFNAAKSVGEIAENSGMGDDWKNWEVKDVCNDQNDSGYYGILIDTKDGNAVIANRGSESTDLSTGYKDWAEADLGLLDSTSTRQQKRAEQYMEKLYYKYGDTYGKFTVGGHSLGGNLAMHMVITAPLDMLGKIDRCTSMDGPGFSEEYMKKHRDEIERTAKLLDHYQWSIVSGLLFTVPGSNIQTIKSHESPSSEGALGKEFSKHSLKNVEYTEDGEFKPGNQSDLAKTADELAKYIDSIGADDLVKEIVGAENLKDYGMVAVYYGIPVLIKTIAAVVRNFDAVRKKLNAWSDSIYYSFIATQVSGIYEVNSKSLYTMANEINQLERKLGELSDEIDTIRKNLKFWSMSGAYYRSSIMCMRNGLESDLKKLKKLVEVAEWYASKYNQTDSYVAGKFVG